eukprot:COSAG02_NODE_55845_length_288_cov_0.825397_1_plen_26_part_10
MRTRYEVHLRDIGERAELPTPPRRVC